MAITYYSPSSILADSQKAPTTFELALDSHLSASLNNGNAIEPGTKIDLPIWLGHILAASEPAGIDTGYMAQLDMPNALGKRVVNALSADPKSVDVRAQAQFFYGLGQNMLDVVTDEEVTNVLVDSFKQRSLEIADKAQNSRQTQQAGGSDEFLGGCDEAERLIYRAAHDASRAVKAWFDTDSHRH